MERLFDKKDSLLVHVVQGDLNTCANSHLETDFNVIETVDSTRVDAVGCLENGIAKLEIRNCQNTRCSTIKAALANAAPTCEWAPFRDWALVVMSCWHVMTHPDPAAPSMQPRKNSPSSFTSDASTEFGESLEVAVEFCADLLLRRRWQPDAFGIFEVLLWISMASASVPSPNHTHSTFEDAELEVPTIRDALDSLYHLPVCQHHTEAKDRNGRTPLHLAALNGHLAVTEALVQAGAALAAKDRDERMPSHLAMEQGNLNLLEFLVNNGDVDARDRDGRTLLHSAASQVMALAHIVSKTESKEAPYGTASDPNGSMPLQNGLTLMRAEIVYAYGTVQRPAAEALLSLQADPDAVDRDLRTPLHVVAIRGASLSETIIQILIKGGASVDKKDRDGRTALHLAALGGHLGASKVLTGHGADVLEKDRNDCTALHLAILEGRLEMATYLVEEGADLTSPDRDGHAPLHLAAKNGHLQIAIFLVEKSADIHVMDRDENTALHLTASEGFLDVVKFLVQDGARFSAQNRDEQSPLHVAA
ncbi:ankyrin repeat-containing domain protein [Xylaria cubensis]|nr:ankyrin repeat-containing domain protein [Xylaria cubensis]